jgi:signal transduction histidine kinase
MIGSLQDITNIKALQDELMQEKLSHQKELSETVIRVQEKERTRIGHELHDNVNQILSTTKLFVDMINPVSEEETELKKKTIDYLLLAIEEIRKLSRELVTPQLTSITLVESIQQLIDDIQRSGVLKIRFVFDHEVEMLGPGKRVTIFRIVQEQIKNILKYSKASEADILLHCRNNILELIVKDNGIGFDPSKTRKGIGLSSINQRVEFYDGNTIIEAAPGKGCILRVSMPFKD